MGNHAEYSTATQLHQPFVVAESDPGAIGAHKGWFKLSTGVLKIRNATDDGWVDFVAGTASGVAWSGITSTPTTLAGYGITDGATDAEVAAAVAALVDSSPAALDTLNELAAALGDDANFASTVTTALAAKAPLASPALTGTPTAPTATAGTNTTQIATTAFVAAAVAAGGGGGGGSLAVEDSGTEIATSVTRLDFTGDVAVTDDGGGQATVNVNGGGKWTPAKTMTAGGAAAGSDDARALFAVALWDGTASMRLGISNAVLQGTGTNVASGGESWGSIASGAGFYTASNAAAPSMRPVQAWRCRAPSSLTGLKVWVGQLGGTPTSVSGTPNVAAFRYDSSTDGTTFQAVTQPPAGTPVTTTDTGVTVTADTTYALTIDQSTAGTVRFYIDGVLVATHTTNLPDSATTAPHWAWTYGGTWLTRRYYLSVGG